MNPDDTGFQAVDWNEPVIYQLEETAVHNSTFPQAEDEIQNSISDPFAELPAEIRRDTPISLPNLSEPEISKHFTRLSQMTQGVDTASHIGMGTCTKKYNPKFSDQLANQSRAANLHPEQPDGTVQGYLEMMYRLKSYLKEISGMDEFSLQPRGGAHAVFANALIIKKYHEEKGQLDTKNEIITSVLSHPCDGAAPAMAGFEVINLYPDEETGIPSPEAFEEALSENTAGMMITNPYDTGKYDSNMRDYIERVHEVDGLVAIDQANLNGIMGKVRIGDVGADLCHFNLHKSFGTPHGSYGPAAGPIGAKEDLAEYLPVPSIEYDGEKYYKSYAHSNSIGKVGEYVGVSPVLLRAYAWIRRMGRSGINEAAEIAVLNNNYLIRKLQEIRGINLPPNEDFRIQEARLSLQEMLDETGVGTDDVARRIVDYGVQNFFKSHFPMVVPEPVTPEPTESVSKAELDHWVNIMEQISEEAYTDPEIVKSAPHKAPIDEIDPAPITDPDKLATTWNAYKRKQAD